ncbi:CheR family methyltransferase [Gemmata sp.]|uniref:CheR family methyltransferase n=1 Tax=Gemmata sp. TaxID=1914242 RepID=UPI003F70F2C6
MREVLAVLRTRGRLDFSGYKKPTVLRRVQRRMGLARVEHLGEYARLLRQTPGEVAALADDLLIHVTGFFRDPDVWEALREQVVAPLVAAREPGAPVRAWVAACSSGEEAYTLAMLLLEESDRAGKRLDIKVFATDLAERALAHARAGVYPGGIESDVSPERLRRFFDRADEVYRVRQEVRDRVVFAPQNILQDPPFGRLDMATCRNLLIYLEPETQRRVLAVLHFGLREGGALVLGTSETPGGADGLFELVDKKHRIFRRVGPTRHGEVDFGPRRALPADGPARAGEAPPAPRPGARPPLGELARRALLASHTPAAVMVDRDHQVLYYHGDVRPYFQLSGEATRDLMLLVRDGVRGAARVALHHAAHGGRGVAPDGWVDAADGRRAVLVTASPVPGPDGEPAPEYFVVSFQASGPAAPAAAPGGEGAGEEARRLRGELQGVIEELQTSNEELKAAHEEATSVNEELQSANEELETGKEEMQSLNEELRAVNGQLRTKVEELRAAASDLASLLASTDLAVLFLDTDLHIRRYTPAVRELLGPIPGDVGRPLADLARRFDDPHLDEDCRAVLDRLVPAEREVGGENGRHYLRRVTPYRTTDNRIEGVVLTFVDVTARRRAEDAVRASEERLRQALGAARMGTWTLDLSTGAHLRDGHLNRLLGLDPVETTQSFDAFLARLHPDDRAAVREAFDASTREGRPLNTEFRIIRPDGTVRWLRDQGDVFGDSAGPRRMAGACADVTERREAEEALRRSEERLRLILESATDFAILTQAPDRTVTVWSAGAVAAFGYAADEVVGGSGDVLFTPEDRAAGGPEREAAEARRAGRAADERWHVRKDGTRFYASGVLTTLPDATGFVKVLRDLTDRKRMEDELRDARDRLEARVAERTADLERARDALEAEMGRRRELARLLGSAQEDERRRVARDLHDTVGQLLAGLSLTLKSLEAGDPPPAAGGLAEAQRIMNDLGRELHGLAVRLRPTSLDDVGLAPALGQLVSEWSSRSGVRADFHASGVEPGRVPAEVETAIYRVVQEALTNVAKHAGASAVGVAVTRSDGSVSVAVEDDGAGFDPDAAPKGRLGLLGMRERVELVGGTFEVESSPGAGTTVAVRIPVPGGAS